MANLLIDQFSQDLKVKRGNTKGFSDGNTVCLSEPIPQQGLEIGPGPGKSWQPLASAGSGEAEGTAINFDPSVDADLEFAMKFADGTEVVVDSQSVGADSLSGILDFADEGFVLTYPQKIIIRPESGGSFPTTGRVRYKQAWTEFDVPRE